MCLYTHWLSKINLPWVKSVKTSPGLLYTLLVYCVFLILARNTGHWCFSFAPTRWVCTCSVSKCAICVKTITVLLLSHRLQRGNIPLHQDVLGSSADKEMYSISLSLQVTNTELSSCWHSPLLNIQNEICVWHGAYEINDICFLQSSKSLCDQQRDLCEDRVPARRDPDGWDTRKLQNVPLI